MIAFFSLTSKKMVGSDFDSDSEPEPTPRQKPIAVEAATDVDAAVTKAAIPAKRVAVAWKCFDRENVYQRNGIDFIKCNERGCGKEYQFNRLTSSNLNRHVEKTHPYLMSKTKDMLSQATISVATKKMVPAFTQAAFKEYLLSLFVVQDLPFRLLETEEFRDLIQLLNPGNSF